MFRRSRFSVQPKVTTKSRASAASQDAPPTNPEAAETTAVTTTASEGGKSSTVTEIPSAVTQSTTAASGEVNDQNADSTNSSAALQRRKRFSVKPKVAPGRPSTHGRKPKSPIKPVSETPAEVPSSDLDKPSTSSQNESTVTSQEIHSPKRRRPSQESTQPEEQSDTTSGSSGPAAVAPPEASLQKTSKQLESEVTDVSSKPPVKAPPSLPEKDTDEISEKAKTLVSSKSGLSLSSSASSLSKLLNDPSDIERLAKAQKLRELLREEKHKERKHRKSKCRGKEYSLDPAKMTMRDLIHYLPMSNPMKSSIADMTTENETVVPSSPGREEPPESAQEPQVSQKEANPSVGDGDIEAVEDDEEEESVMVPQVKVAEDGSLIIDEESLTVEVQRTKGPNTMQERDPIFERGSTTTYSSFRTLKMGKPWSSEETDMFFLAISMVGTDFSMICQLFPHRSRTEIKNKFKKEERENCWRIDKAFRDKRKLDIEYFSKLLEKILEFQKNKKKLKAVTKKNAPKKSQRKKGKKKSRKLSDIQEEDEDEEELEDEVLDLEDEEEGGEKENDNLANEDETVSKPKRQRKRKTKQDDLNEEPNNNKKKRAAENNGQGETSTPEDTEAALPENHTSTETCEKTDDVNPSKDTAVKPAKLSRTRAAKPLLPLGRKWGKKPPLPSTRPEESTADEENENVSDGVTDEVNKESSPVKQASLEQSAEAEVSSEEEYPTVQPPRPTRYGRMPKPTKLLTYSAKEDQHADAPPASSVDTAASNAKSKPKCGTKRGRTLKQQSTQESKKPKLVTLRASQSEYSDDEEETQLEDHEEAEREVESEDGTACVFVPASLRSPPPVIAEVEETMEELDILANMPDVLGISQDALCHDVSWDKAQNQTGSAEPCEHQLDLLVDVIDYLSSEQTEVCEDEGYNEAAQTLLTISNMMHLPQTAENQSAAQDDATEELPECSRKSQPHTDVEETAVNSSDGASQTPEPSSQVVDDTDCGSQMFPSPEESERNSPQPRKGRPKLKAKPNLAAVSRTAEPRSQSDHTSEQTKHGEESNTPPEHFPASETLSAHEEVAQITDSPSVFAPLSDTESIVPPPEKLSTNKESERTYIHQILKDPVLPTTGLGVSEEQIPPDIPFEPNISDACSSSAVLEKEESTQDESESHGNLLQTGQNTSQHPASCDSSFSKKEGTEAEPSPGSQLRRSRSQKVKPVPNISGTLRNTRSRTPVVKEQDQSTSSENQASQSTSRSPVLTQSPNSTCEATTELSPRRDEKIQHETSVGALASPAAASGQSDLTNQDAGSTLAPTDDKCLSQSKTSGNCSEQGSVSTAEQDLTSIQEVSEHTVTQKESPVPQQVESEVKSPISSRRSRFPRVQPRIPQTSRTTKLQTKKDLEEKDLIAPGPSFPNKSNPPIVSTTNLSPTEEVDRSLAVTNLQTGQESNPRHESSEHPVAVERSEVQMKFDSDKTGSQAEEEKSCGETVLPEGDLTVGQKDESKVASPCTSRRRWQKVKPKVNIPQMLRPSKLSPQKPKDLAQKESTPASVREQGELSTSPENETSLDSGLLSGLIPSFDVGSTFTNEQSPTAEQKRADEKIVGQTCAVGSPSGHVQSENHSRAGVLLEHISGNIETAREKAICRDATAECSNNTVTFDTAPARLNRGENVAPIQEECRSLDVEVVTVSHTEESDAVQRVTQSKPTCSEHRITDSVQDVIVLPEKQIEGADTDGASVQPAQQSTCEKPTSLTVKPKSELGLEITSDSPKASVPQRRRHFPKVKPNLVSSPRRTSTTQRQRNSTETSDQEPVGVPEVQVERTDRNVQIKGVNSPSDVEGNSGESAITEANERRDSTGGVNTSSSCISIATTFVADILKKSVTEHKVSDVSLRESESTEGEMSNDVEVDAGRSRTPSQSADDSTTASGFLSSQEPHASSTQDKGDVGSYSQSSQSDLHSSSTTTAKAPQTRRGRLMKPTPNLKCSRALQPQNQSITQDVTDTGVASVPGPVSEVQPDIQEPVKENIQSSSEECLRLDSDSMLVQQNEQDPSVDVTFLGSGTQGLDISQIAPTVSLVETAPQCSTVFPALTSEHLPSDPDEPFFILSLTEIPVSSSGEMMDPSMETHHYVGDAFMQHQSSDSGQTVAPAAEESPFEVSYTDVNAAELDQDAHTDVSKENPLVTQGSTAPPPTSPETKDNKNTAESSCKMETKQRLPQRRANLQAKPDTSRTRGSRTLSVDNNHSSDLPEFSKQPQVLVENNELDPHKQIDGSLNTIKGGPAGGSGPDVSEANAKIENMKTSTNSDPSVETERPAKGEQSTSIREDSTSQVVASCSHVTRQPEETSSSPLTASSLEKSVQQTTEHGQLHSDPDAPVNKQSPLERVEEESTTVSEYFFSDIFTPVGDD